MSASPRVRPSGDKKFATAMSVELPVTTGAARAFSRIAASVGADVGTSVGRTVALLGIMAELAPDSAEVLSALVGTMETDFDFVRFVTGFVKVELANASTQLRSQALDVHTGTTLDETDVTIDAPLPMISAFALEARADAMSAHRDVKMEWTPAQWNTFDTRDKWASEDVACNLDALPALVVKLARVGIFPCATSLVFGMFADDMSGIASIVDEMEEQFGAACFLGRDGLVAMIEATLANARGLDRTFARARKDNVVIQKSTRKEIRTAMLTLASVSLCAQTVATASTEEGSSAQVRAIHRLASTPMHVLARALRTLSCEPEFAWTGIDASSQATAINDALDNARGLGAVPMDIDSDEMDDSDNEYACADLYDPEGDDALAEVLRTNEEHEANVVAAGLDDDLIGAAGSVASALLTILRETNDACIAGGDDIDVGDAFANAAVRATKQATAALDRALRSHVIVFVYNALIAPAQSRSIEEHILIGRLAALPVSSCPHLVRDTIVASVSDSEILNEAATAIQRHMVILQGASVSGGARAGDAADDKDDDRRRIWTAAVDAQFASDAETLTMGSLIIAAARKRRRGGDSSDDEDEEGHDMKRARCDDDELVARDDTENHGEPVEWAHTRALESMGCPAWISVAAPRFFTTFDNIVRSAIASAFKK